MSMKEQLLLHIIILHYITLHYQFWIKTGGLVFVETVFTDVQSHNCLEDVNSDILNNHTQDICIYLLQSGSSEDEIFPVMNNAHCK